MGIPCHSERSEESITLYLTTDLRFFASLRMTKYKHYATASDIY